MGTSGVIYNPESANQGSNLASMCRWPAQPWYAIRTVARSELKARDFLSEVLQIETFLPQIKTRHKNLFQALFPCYVFSRSPLSLSTELKRAGGIIGAVEFGGKPAQIHESIIESLREGTDQAGYFTANELKIGERVIILQGAFAEKSGTIERFRKEELLQVILESSLNFKVELSRYDVVRA